MGGLSELGEASFISRDSSKLELSVKHRRIVEIVPAKADDLAVVVEGKPRFPLPFVKEEADQFPFHGGLLAFNPAVELADDKASVDDPKIIDAV